MSLDINTAGCEFVQSVLSLYRSAKYFREKEILAGKLLEHSFEAGRLTEEVGECEEQFKSDYAKRAIEELSKALFALKVMGEECIYPLRKISPVATLGNQLKDLLRLYVKAEVPAEPAPETQPAVQDNNEQLSLLSIEYDGGGFNEVYTGKI